MGGESIYANKTVTTGAGSNSGSAGLYASVLGGSGLSGSGFSSAGLYDNILSQASLSEDGDTVTLASARRCPVSEYTMHLLQSFSTMPFPPTFLLFHRN